MARRSIPVLLVALAVLACGGREEREIGARLSVAAALGGDQGEGYARATEVPDLRFPADHGPHPDYRTEWWYFTGNLAATDATTPDREPRRFGYQLTFFRTAVAPPEDAMTEKEAPEDGGAHGGRDGDAPASDWRTRQVYMAHFALTDVGGERFAAAERFSRGAAGLAGAEAHPFRVWTEGWSARTEISSKTSTPETGGTPLPHHQGTSEVGGTLKTVDPFMSETGGTPGEGGGGDFFPLRLVAADDGDGGGAAGVPFAIDLVLTEGKGRVLQGELGLSRKGPEEGNASYYYTYPRMPTTGTVTVGGETFRVAGASWLDREWSTSVLGEGQAGWDWFALQLEDGREVVFYRIRSATETGTPTEGSGPLDYAALVPADPDRAGPGRLRVLDPAGATLEVLDRWTSPRSGVTWPAGWHLRLPAADLDLRIRPRIRDQELNLAFRYWEGTVAVEGTADGRPVTGQGYAELTGYGDAAARTR